MRTGWRTATVVLAVALVVSLTGLGVLWAGHARGYPESSPELGFSRDMYAHHQQAVVMSQLVLDRGSDPEVATLARDITSGQAEQQGILLGWLHERGAAVTSDEVPMAWAAAAGDGAGGHDMGSMTTPDAGPGSDSGSGGGGAAAAGATTGAMAGLADDEQLSALGRASGVQADLQYVELMIPHHEAAVVMAEDFERLSDEPQLTWLSDGVLTTQERELGILTQLRTRLQAEVDAA